MVIHDIDVNVLKLLNTMLLPIFVLKKNVVQLVYFTLVNFHENGKDSV